MLSRVEAMWARRRVRRQHSNAAAPPQPTLARGTDTLPQIDHIVVLMMENHSHDNYFGMLDRGDGLPRNEQGLPSPTNTAADGTIIAMQRFTGTVQKDAVPTQSWRASHTQWDEGSCAGFVRSIEQGVPGEDASVAMTYWTEE